MSVIVGRVKLEEAGFMARALWTGRGAVQFWLEGASGFVASVGQPLPSSERAIQSGAETTEIPICATLAHVMNPGKKAEQSPIF